MILVPQNALVPSAMERNGSGKISLRRNALRPGVEDSMSIPTVRTITRNERAWLNREFQMFCGRFELDQSSGLFFAELTPGYHRQMIGEDFLALPLKLREVALYLGLTVSTTKEQRTSSGHASAVYGDWDRPHSKISPHLEMSVASLDSTRLCLAHLAHECFSSLLGCATGTGASGVHSKDVGACREISCRRRRVCRSYHLRAKAV